MKPPLPTAVLLLLSLLLLGAPALALEEATGTKPYLLAPPPDYVTPPDRDRGQLYRDNLQRDLGRLQSEQDRGTLDPLDRRTLLDKKSELNRMNRILTPRPRAEPYDDPVDGSLLLEPRNGTRTNPILGR